MSKIETALSEVREIEFPEHVNPSGELIVLEKAGGLPFDVQRSFIVKGRPNAVRGTHAHKLCSQLMICVSGAIDVVCDDGAAQADYTLRNPKDGLLVPPGIWSQQTYLEDDTILLVLCDRPYEEDDYIRDRDAYLRFRGISETSS
ncbi:MAG: FdtA/QdtA family cupin domain-containing protein [Alphaproteobacteria bacterium]